MPTRAFYPSPPMPPRTVPPRVFTPIQPADTTADNVIVTLNNLNVVLISWQKPFYKLPRLNPIAAIIDQPAQAADIPLANKSNLINIIQTWYTAKAYIPRQLPPLSGSLIDDPSTTVPPPKRLETLRTTNIWWIQLRQYKSPQRLPSVRLEPPIVPSLFVGRLIAFQPNAFQIRYPSILTAFQGFNRAVKLRNTIVRSLLTLKVFINGELGMQHIKAGASIVISCQVTDPSTAPPQLITPDGVFLTLTDPADLPFITLAQMSEISTGYFTYIHQTLVTDTKGAYGYNILASIGSNQDTIIDEVAFILD